MIKSVREHNLLETPNIDIVALLEITGYSAVETYEVGQKVEGPKRQMVVTYIKTTSDTKSHAGKEPLQKPQFVVSLFAKKDSVLVNKLVRDVLKNTANYLKSGECQFNEQTKDTFTNFLNNQTDITAKLKSGAFGQDTKRLFKALNAVEAKDMAVKANIMQGQISLGKAFDNWVKENASTARESITEGRSLASDSAYVTKAVSGIMTGEDITPLVQHATSTDLGQSLYKQ